MQEAYGYDEKALLNHFLNYGLAEGRVASPIFDITYYKKNNQDLVAAYGNDLKKYCTHFAVYGMNEGRQGCASFNVNSYNCNMQICVKHMGMICQSIINII